MNSLDPWRTIVTDAFGDVVLPRPYYGHPFYTEVPSWIHYGDDDSTTRQLFDGAFIGGDPVVAGFFDDVKKGILKYTGTSATNQFIKDQGLEPYVKMAATAVATYYGGPAAGAAAGAIQPFLSNLGTKDKKKEAEAQSQLQQVKTAVQATDPSLAPAVDIAADAIQKTAIAYHVAKITNDAKAGNADAKKALENLKQAASKGDAQAQQVLKLVDVIEHEQTHAETTGTVAGWVDIVGANMTHILGAELTALSAPGAFYGRYRQPYGPVYSPYYGPAYRPLYGQPYGRYGYPFVGTTAPAPVPSRGGLLAEVATVMAPATGGITVKKELDEKQVLHVEICVDGKCYRTSMDLAPAIAMVMQKLARWHEDQHAQKELLPSTVVSTVKSAISAAGDAMVDVMAGHHVAVMTSGWLSDIGGAIGGTMRKLQGPITLVATKVAEAYGGPAAGAAAGALAPMVTDLQANALDPKGDPKKRAEAQRAIQRVNQAASTDPAAVQALAAANQAVKNTAVAYHVKDTAQRAAAGDAAAQKDINNLVTAAEQGDPAAKSTFDVLAQTLAQEVMTSETGAKWWEKVTGRGPDVISSSGWHDIVGAAIDDVREKARAHAITKPGVAAGVLITTEGQLHGRGFRNLDDAIDWLDHITRNRGSFTYAAAYEKDAAGSAFIQAEEIGGTSQQPRATPTPIPRDRPAMTGQWR